MSNISYGFTPRIYPRPIYPSFITLIWSFIKGCFIDGVLLCTIISYIFYIPYQNSINKIKNILSLKYDNDQFIFTILLSSTHIIIWCLVNIPLYIFDKYGYYQNYKLYRTNGQIPNSSLINHTFITTVISQFITSPIMGYYIYPVFVYFGMLPLNAKFPMLLDLMKTYMIGYLFNDTFFYFTHRLLHMKSLYFLHKQHHSYAGTMGISAEYAHPVEILLSNILPTIGGVVLFGCHHPYCVIIWITMRLQQTYMAHSGYAFKNTLLDFVGLAHSDSAIFHDHHHTTNRGNFGGNMLWDYLFGTMDSFVASGGFDGYLQRGKQVETPGTKMDSDIRKNK